MAMVQAHEFKNKLVECHDINPDKIELVPFSTKGDRVINKPIREIGGKGIFCTEIETALLLGDIEFAVHSLKDMPTQLPTGLIIDCVLEREDPRDVLLANNTTSIEMLCQGTTVGTSSIRRKRQILYHNNKVCVVELRGNVQTRIDKWRNGYVDCTLLAMAGLKRLQLMKDTYNPIEIEKMTPAPAQGAIGIERRVDDTVCVRLIADINNTNALICTSAERAFLARLEANCDLPVGAYAKITDKGSLELRGEYFGPESSFRYFGIEVGSADYPEEIGKRLADRLLE